MYIVQVNTKTTVIFVYVWELAGIVPKGAELID
jgi:hypothetical protein